MFSQMHTVKSSIRPEEGGTREDPPGHSFDELDLRIIRALLADSRSSAREIASNLGVSTSTVTARMEKLRKGQIIKSFTASIDYQRLGYDLTVITEIIVSKGRLLEMEREIAKIPGVLAVYDVTGQIDAIVISKCRNREELSRFTKALLTMPFVERTNSHVVLTTVKEDFRIPL